MSRSIKFRAWWPDDKVMEYDFEHDLGNYLTNETELMQFTGLLDKNGREIYEGDIVVADGSQFRGVVTWYKGLPGFMIFANKATEFSFLGGTIWEVLGNIYENPELLKKDGEHDQ